MKEFKNPVIDFLYRFMMVVFGTSLILISAASILVLPAWVAVEVHWALGILTFLFFLCLQLYLTDIKIKPEEDNDE